MFFLIISNLLKLPLRLSSLFKSSGCNLRSQPKDNLTHISKFKNLPDSALLKNNRTWIHCWSLCLPLLSTFWLFLSYRYSFHFVWFIKHVLCTVHNWSIVLLVSIIASFSKHVRHFGYNSSSRFCSKTTFWGLNSVSVLRRKTTQLGPIDSLALSCLSIGPNWVSISLTMETESNLRNVFK